MSEDSYGKRLDRIEEKIDKLWEAVVSLARVEERLGTIEAKQRQTDMDDRKMIERFQAMCKQVDDNTRTTNWINRIGYGIAAAVGAILANDLWMFFSP